MKHLKIKIDKLEFSDREILKNIEFTLNENDKIAIVWPNWVWKTSFFKLLVWDNKNFDWFIENVWGLSLWYLNQIYSDNEEKSVKDELKLAFIQILEMEVRLKEVEYSMIENPDDLDLINTYTSLLEQFNNSGWYEYQNKIHSVANWMGILELLDNKLVEVSWWQRTKIALAKILLQSPDILFLDEPTNFIDIAWVEWLESYLKNKWKGWYVIISHDREFLDKTCTQTYEVQWTLWVEFYHTNYSWYVIERERRELKKIQNFVRQDEYIKKQEQLINRFRAGSRAGWAKSREKMIEKMEKIEKPFILPKPKFFFEEFKDSSEKMLIFKEAFIWRTDPLFYISDATLFKKQRIWIVWENGCWKSTLLKTIMKQIPILDWYFNLGKTTKIVYYSQLHEELDKNKTIRDNFIKFWLEYPDEFLIWFLKHYLFEKADLDKKVSDLSGGQTSKLLFSLLGQKESNLLILDEPTNHLDYDTREALEQVLSKYSGTILFISHDRYFINKLATNIWFVSEGELSISYWNYEDYRFKLENWINMDFNLFDEESELNLVLEEKLSDRQIKRMKYKFWDKKKNKK
jgi:ATP-binding cassette subfamily F protein 3